MANQSVNVREAFVARPGYYFIDVDYSQIEFRLSAALAGEKSLVQGFMKGNDYYKMVYSAMAGGKPVDQVTKQERDLGKVLALGQQYGQEKHGLARKLKCDVERAGVIMDQYWSGLGATRQAKETALQNALRTGVVATWFNRQRPLPELFSKVPRLKAKAQRSVWSTIIQGTAADWMKIALLRASRGLRDRDAHILLTVHDELLFEVSEQESLQEITSIIVEAMQFKVKGLPIGLTDLYPDGYFVPVNVDYGYNWGSLMSLEDEMVKGKLVQGFRSYCAEHGKPVNFDQPTEHRTYSFLAEPSKEPVVLIQERQHHVQGKEETVQMSSISGKHPIDQLLLIAKEGATSVPTTSVPTTSVPTIKLPAHVPNAVVIPRQPELPLTANDILTKAMEQAAEVDKQLESEPPPPAPIPVEIQPETERSQPLTNGHTVAETTPPDNDFIYPCIVITPQNDLNEKNVKFTMALFAKFVGDYWVFIQYKDKTIRAGEKYKINPTGDLLAYLKKGMGEGTTVEIYDTQGKPSRGKVNFV